MRGGTHSADNPADGGREERPAAQDVTDGVREQQTSASEPPGWPRLQGELTAAQPSQSERQAGLMPAKESDKALVRCHSWCCHHTDAHSELVQLSIM